jgi:sortase B
MRRLLTKFLTILSVAFILVSLYVLIGMMLENRKSQDTFDEIKIIFDQGASEEDQEDEPEEEISVNPGLLKLHEINSDCIGWIQIEGTNIDYPVMYHPEEENFYLRKNFYREYDMSGTPFISEICNPEDFDNLILYGHHMKNGTMFADVDKYKDSDFYKEHPIITYSTLHGDETYEIFACFAVPVYTGSDFQYYAFTKAESSEEYQAFVETCKKLSYYDTGITAEYGDQLITLSTCEYTHKNGRMVIVGKLIREED